MNAVMNSKTVELDVSRAGMIKSMADSFTNREACIRELLQNARRAGATDISVHTLDERATICVVDNGSGIEDPQSLFLFGHSDWNSKTVMEEESPFGVGFSSAIFLGEHLRVESNGWAVSTPTSRLLEMEAVKVEQSSFKDGTIVELTLSREDYRALDINAHLTRMAIGFPVPIALNGSYLQRPHAIDNLSGTLSTQIGLIETKNIDNSLLYDASFHIYLQGFFMGEISRYTWSSDSRPTWSVLLNNDSITDRIYAVHLDSDHFRARMPDRDKLVNEDTAFGEIKSAINDHFARYLKEMERTMTGREFAMTFTRHALRWAPVLLNDKPLDRDALWKFPNLPHESDYYEYDYAYLGDEDGLIDPSEDLIVDPTFSFDEWFGVTMEGFHESIEENNAALAYMLQVGVATISHYFKALDPNHWVFKHAVSMYEEFRRGNLYIEATETPRNPVDFPGRFIDMEVVFCDAYRIKSNNPRLPSIRISEYPYHNQSMDQLIIPLGAGSESLGSVIQQVSTYCDEFGDFEDDAYESDLHDLMCLAELARNKDAGGFLHSMVRDSLRGYSEVLKGKSFKIAFSDDGQMFVAED